MNNDHDLCAILVEEMGRLEFSPNSIAQVCGHVHFQQARNQPSPLQRTYLIMVASSIFNRANFIVPAEIRLGLNMANDVIGWLDDLKLVILPFLKVNEERFF